MITPQPKSPGAPQRFWQRVKALAARLFRRELAAGHFETGQASSSRGLLTTAPLVPPVRDYLVYVPRGHSRLRRAPLVITAPRNPAALAYVALWEELRAALRD